MAKVKVFVDRKINYIKDNREYDNGSPDFSHSELKPQYLTLPRPTSGESQLVLVMHQSLNNMHTCNIRGTEMHIGQEL